MECFILQQPCSIKEHMQTTIICKRIQKETLVTIGIIRKIKTKLKFFCVFENLKNSSD